MCAIPQLASAPLNPIPIAEHFRRSHPQCEHSYWQDILVRKTTQNKCNTLNNELSNYRVGKTGSISVVQPWNQHTHLSSWLFIYLIIDGKTESIHSGLRDLHSMLPTRCFNAEFRKVCMYLDVFHHHHIRLHKADFPVRAVMSLGLGSVPLEKDCCTLFFFLNKNDGDK